MKPQLRCSSLDRLLDCNGSPTIEAIVLADSFDIGDAGGTEITWRGNWCHWEAARRLIMDHGAIGPEGGLKPPDLPKGWKPTQWEYRTVEWFLAMLLEATPEGHVFYVEQAFRWETDTFVLTGHIDVFSISADGEEVHWTDQKTGMAEVDHADNNWQVGGYGGLLRNHFPLLKRGTARILQRTSSSPCSEVEIDDMSRIMPHLEKHINAAFANPLELNTGKHCNYCAGLCIPCPAVRKHINTMKLLLTPEEVTRLQAVPALKDLGDIAHEFRQLSTAGEKIVESFRDRMTVDKPVLLTNGKEARLVEENGPRKATHPKAIFEFCVDRVGEDKMWECFDPSFGAIEDSLVESGMKRTSKKEDSAKGVIDSMAHLYERKKVLKLKFLSL